ncbi:MAG: hypothetical protein AAB874_01930 [Patescibacteria group bacterium]
MTHANRIKALLVMGVFLVLAIVFVYFVDKGTAPTTKIAEVSLIAKPPIPLFDNSLFSDERFPEVVLPQVTSSAQDIKPEQKLCDSGRSISIFYNNDGTWNLKVLEGNIPMFELTNLPLPRPSEIVPKFVEKTTKKWNVSVGMYVYVVESSTGKVLMGKVLDNGVVILDGDVLTVPLQGFSERSISRVPESCYVEVTPQRYSSVFGDPCSPGVSVPPPSVVPQNKPAPQLLSR